MPETSQPVRRLRQQTAKVLAALKQEIAIQEQELAALKDEAAQWQRVLGRPPPRTRGAVAPGRARRAGRRVNWSTVLATLPTTFTAKDVAERAGKPVGHVYTSVSRWMKDQKVTKRKDGYLKVSALPARERGKGAREQAGRVHEKKRT